jgi:ABC-type nitrate/sulfonate/bicarbonate transport system permease component
MAEGDKPDSGSSREDKLAGSNPVEPKPAEPKAAPAATPKKQVDAERMPPDKKAQEAKESAGHDEGIPSPPPWYRTLRADPPFYVRIGLGAGFLFLILFLWWFVTRGSATEAIISPVKLTSPGDTFGSLGKLADRDLTASIIDSLQRVLLGIGLAAIVGIVLGVTAGAHRGVSATLAPLVIFLRSVPMGALLPLTAMMFGDGEKQKWMFIFLAVVPFVFSDVMKAVASVPDRYVETAQTLGASRIQIIMKVLVPLSLPDIVTSLRFQFGLALGYIILAEAGSTFVNHGLGKMITVSERLGPREHVFLLLFVIAFIAFLLDFLMRTLQRGVFPWRKDL